MRPTWILLVLALGTSAEAAAPPEALAALHACQQLDDDAQRLVCYDGALGRAPAPRAEPARGPRSSERKDRVQGLYGKWVVMDDRVGERVVLTAMLHADSGDGLLGGPVALLARCDAGRLQVFARWRQPLDAATEIVLMVGSEEPVVRAWPLSEDRQDSFVPGSPGVFLERLAGADSLVLQARSPAPGRRVVGTFDPRGVAEVVPLLRRGCTL